MRERDRLAMHGRRRRRRERVLRFLQDEVWAAAPEGALGRMPTREEEDELLGYGPEGV